jgi:hypothetical protein
MRKLCRQSAQQKIVSHNLQRRRLQAFQAHRPDKTSATAVMIASEPLASSVVTAASRGRLA